MQSGTFDRTRANCQTRCSTWGHGHGRRFAGRTRVGRDMAYAFLAGDDAVPEHQVDGAIRQRRRLGHEALKRRKQASKHRINGPNLKTATERGSTILAAVRRRGEDDGAHARGGASCATPCAPRRGDRGRRLRTPSDEPGSGALCLSFGGKSSESSGGNREFGIREWMFARRSGSAPKPEVLGLPIPRPMLWPCLVSKKI